MSKNRDITTEQWIQQWIERSNPVVEQIVVEQIDFIKSQAVQNRGGIKLDEDHATRILEWLEDQTHTVAPIVVNRVGARFHIIDGNHRAYASSIAGRQFIDAYVVQVDQETFEGMVLAANARNAKELSPRQRIDQAIQQAERFGTTVAAAQFLMKPEDLNRAQRAAAGRKKYEQVFRKKADQISERKAELLNRLDEDQIERIGADNLREATLGQLEQTVRNIAAVPAVQRHDQAIREAGRLAQVRQEKKTPAGRRERAKRKVTVSVIRAKVHEVAKYLRDNPAALNDQALMKALAELGKVVSSDVSAEHAA